MKPFGSNWVLLDSMRMFGVFFSHLVDFESPFVAMRLFELVIHKNEVMEVF